MRKFLTIIFTMFAVFSSTFAGNYNLDKSHSNVGFNVDHMVIATVSGNFSDFSVSLNFDENNLSDFAVEAAIKIASVNTDNEKRDKHLASPDFFDAAQFPEMTFKSTKLEKTAKGYIAHGTLTMRGVSKEIALPFAVKGPIKDPWGNTRIGIKASTEINRKDFGVSWSKTMDNGGLIASDEVEIVINAEFIQAK
ncbi:MAG: YceI family protein [Calditrichaeota bacterium]|nr:YceI family protein [Calditrichota bacterium]